MMNTHSEVILSIDAVSKKFCRNLKKSLFYGVQDIIGEVAATRKAQDTLRSGEFWAVNKVNLELNKGDAIGLVGANGSGKTTLLRMVSGLIKPDSGEIKVVGRVVPLIALGAGFNPILSGRENVYVNLAILGLTKHEINEVFQDVIDFAEINDALDSPVQTYSSGMAARLGFACAVHAKADVLLIDEVLSVGDMRFRSKCYRKLAQLRSDGASFILVSHNTNAILSMCNKALYLVKGKPVMMGAPSEVMAKFEEDLCLIPSTNQSGKLVLPPKAPQESTGLDITCISLQNHEENDTQHLLTGQPANLVLSVECKAPQYDVMVSFLVKELSGESDTVLQMSSEKQNVKFDFKLGKSEIRLNLPQCGMRPGIYTAKIYLHKSQFYMLDIIESFVFQVKSNVDMNQCQYYQDVNWNQSDV